MVGGILSAVGSSVNGLPSTTVSNATALGSNVTGLPSAIVSNATASVDPGLDAAPAVSSAASSSSTLARGVLSTDITANSSASAAPPTVPGTASSASSAGGAVSSPTIVEGAATTPGTAAATVIGSTVTPSAATPSDMSPLEGMARLSGSTTPLAVNHQGQFPAVTMSFNLAPGVALGQAVELINRAEQDIHMPSEIRGTFAGTAQAFQDSLANEPMLILAALLSVYIVLGILYESYVHPITILSTLPSAGIGALLALNICGIDLSVIALVGIILLIGIVKKNAILMIDFALAAERTQGKPPEEAIFQACLLRFRPIMMTTMAALLGGLPLALGTGYGSELRRPLGVAIVGGLIVSQMLTLFTTPVVYLYLDRLRLWGLGLTGRGPESAPAALQT